MTNRKDAAMQQPSPAAPPYTLAEWRELDPLGSMMHRGMPCPTCGDAMIYPTACHHTFEQRVWSLAGLDGYTPWSRADLIRVNAAMRALDDSHLWPIRSRFNATDRAINRVRRYSDGCIDSLDSYVLAVDAEIGRIVNDPQGF